MNKKINIDFNSNLNQIVQYNKHFDKGILRIAYHGRNRNGSSISKKSFENAVIKSLFYTPVVTHYLEDGELGGHDSEILMTDDGDFVQRYLTTPIGLIPQNANYWWELIQEENGELHEYLCTETLLWKRQDAYNKIKQDGKVKHSMEIDVEDYEMQGDTFVIKDFTFTAFCLIGVEPCFESSSLTLFSLDKETFKQEFSEMIKELKENEVISDMEDNKTIDVVEVDIVDEVVEEIVEDVVEQVEETVETVDEVIEETIEVAEEETETVNEVEEEVTVETTIEEKYAELEKEFAQLQIKYSEMEKEFERLSNFEKDALEKEMSKKKEDMFAKYSTVLSEDEMKDIKDNAEYSLEKIEVELNKLVVAKAMTNSVKTKFSKEEDGLYIAEPKKDKMKSRYAI